MYYLFLSTGKSLRLVVSNGTVQFGSEFRYFSEKLSKAPTQWSLNLEFNYGSSGIKDLRQSNFTPSRSCGSEKMK